MTRAPALRLPSAHARLAHLERRLAALSDDLAGQRADTESLLKQLLKRLPPPAAEQKAGAEGSSVRPRTPIRSRSRVAGGRTGGDGDG